MSDKASLLDGLYTEMDRRFSLKKHEDDYLPNDDTQIGVEFAFDYLSKYSATPDLLHSLKGMLSIYPLPDNSITLAAKAVVEKVESQS